MLEEIGQWKCWTLNTLAKAEVIELRDDHEFITQSRAFTLFIFIF